MPKCWECGCKVDEGVVRCPKCAQSLQGVATTGFWVPKNRLQTGQDSKELIQPLGKDGYSNPAFDKLYGHKTINPFWGTERDHMTRGMSRGERERYASRVREYKVKQGVIRQ